MRHPGTDKIRQIALPLVRWITALTAAAVLAASAPLLPSVIPPFTDRIDAYAKEEELFYRFDSSRPTAGLEKLKHVRLLTEGQYTLKELDKKDLKDPSFVPFLESLDDLRISGSPQYTEKQFRELADEIRALAGSDPVYVIDLRQESHFFVDGMPVSV